MSRFKECNKQTKAAGEKTECTYERNDKGSDETEKHMLNTKLNKLQLNTK